MTYPGAFFGAMTPVRGAVSVLCLPWLVVAVSVLNGATQALKLRRPAADRSTWIYHRWRAKVRDKTGSLQIATGQARKFDSEGLWKGNNVEREGMG